MSYGKGSIGKVCYMRVRVVDVLRANGEEDEVAVECIDRGGNVQKDERGRERWYLVRPDHLVPSNVAAAERRSA